MPLLSLDTTIRQSMTGITKINQSNGNLTHIRQSMTGITKINQSNGNLAHKDQAIYNWYHKN